jgi:hypothetical protein
MLDMYEFDGDIWLCHSFQGQCYNFTAFVSSICMFEKVILVLEKLMFMLSSSTYGVFKFNKSLFLSIQLG